MLRQRDLVASMIRAWLLDGPAPGEHIRERYDPVIKVEVIDPVAMQWNPEVQAQDVELTSRVVEYHVMYVMEGNAKRPARDALGRYIYQRRRHDA